MRMVDVGDADTVHTDMAKIHANTEFAIRKILTTGATPLLLGGDHSIHSPVIKAFDGKPLRRVSEMSHISGMTHSGMTQLGIPNVSSTKRQD